MSSMDEPSSRASSTTISSSSSISSGRPSKRHVTARQQRKEENSAATVYALRQRTNLRSPTPHVEQLGGTKNGRLQSWQNDILQHTFEAGIRNPGDVTVMLLVAELKDRTEKQVRDWFSHRRRRLRESGASYSQERDGDDKLMALEGLILLRSHHHSEVLVRDALKILDKRARIRNQYKEERA